MVNLKKMVVGWGLAGSLFAGVGDAGAAVILAEGFNGVVLPAGWTVVNNSNPVGPASWFKGNPAIFSAQAGAADSYAAANFNAAAPGGNISDWLLTPVLTLHNTDTISFFTRSHADLPDRLELRLSSNGASANVGSTDSSVGDFTTLLLTVNPTLSASGYPSNWTQFTAALTSLGGPISGRFGFRYFLPNTDVNGDYIGIDTVLVSTTVPEPSTPLALALGFALMGWQLRRSSIR